MKKKFLEMLLMAIMSTTLMMVGLWHVMDNACLWLTVTGIGLIGGLYVSNEFSKLQFGEIEVEGED